MNKAFSIFLPLFSTMVALCCGCSGLGPVAGGSSQQGNGLVVGRVIDASGNSAACVTVELLPALHDPVGDSSSDVFFDTTDNDGYYSIAVISAGTYTAVAVQELTGKKALITGITMTPPETVSAPQAVLQNTGSIKIEVPETFSASGGYVYLPGTTLFGPVNNGYAVIDSVPAAEIPSVNFTPAAGSGSTVIRYNLRVASGDTLTVVNPAWKYSRRLFLNTAPSGAGVAGNVYHFPILVRLAASNFNFTQAQTGGNDLRFTKPDNAFLPYEIERWDAIAGRADIWVKIDTIYGNDSVQSIVMYWGNPAAADSSSGTAVFDTEEGFEGVWHLGDASADTVRDATPNRYHGVSPDSARPSISEGFIGKCRAFDGNEDFITMPNTAGSKLDFTEDGYYSVSAWVYLDTFDFVYRTIVAKGYEQYYLRFTAYPSEPLWEFVEFDRNSVWQTSTHPATEKQWTFLTGVRAGSSQYLFYNGELVDSIIENYFNESFSRDTSNDLSIGGFMKEVTFPTEGGYCFFKGKIDEVRISGQARGRDWIRLSYMNQRSDDRLVQFK